MIKKILAVWLLGGWPGKGRGQLWPRRATHAVAGAAGAAGAAAAPWAQLLGESWSMANVASGKRLQNELDIIITICNYQSNVIHHSLNLIYLVILEWWFTYLLIA